MTKPHEKFTTGDTIIAIIPASAIIALAAYLIGGFGFDVHFLIYTGIWLFLYLFFSFIVLAGKKIGAAQDAQIEMNERQKADPPGVSEQHPPVAAEKQETPAGDQKLKRRGDVPSAPPPSDNWIN